MMACLCVVCVVCVCMCVCMCVCVCVVWGNVCLYHHPMFGVVVGTSCRVILREVYVRVMKVVRVRRVMRMQGALSSEGCDVMRVS